MFRRALMLGIILPVIVYVGKLVAVWASGVQLGEFRPVCAIFLLDVSASNRNLLYKEQQTVLRLAKRLDSEDHARIYVVTQDAYEIYDGFPNKLVAMRTAMEKNSKFDANAYGTAYGLAIKKAVGDALRYKAEGYTPAIVVLGDLENEGAVDKQINWNTFPKNLQNTLKYIPDLSLTFLYAHPQKLDFVRQALLPAITDSNAKESQLIIASEENVDIATRKFTAAVGR